MAPCSQPGTSTQTTVMSAGEPRACWTASDSRTGSRASAMATASASFTSSSRSASCCTGTTPTVRLAPARWAAASESEPLLPAPPMTATVGTRPRATYCSTTRAVSAGAPATSMTAIARRGGRSSGTVAAIVRPKRIACPSQGTCSLRPSQRARPSVITKGVRLSETRVVTCWPTVTSSVACGPTSSTTPTSMPPDPVTGFCILPRLATMSSTSARTASPSPPCLSNSCRNEAASRFRTSTETRISSGHSSGLASSRVAAWGSTPRGSMTRCRPTGDDGVVRVTRRSCQEHRAAATTRGGDSPVRD